MPKAWQDVAASPEFQMMPPERQAAARDQYFDQVVAPRVPEGGIEVARSQFLQASGIGEPVVTGAGLSRNIVSGALGSPNEYQGPEPERGVDDIAASLGRKAVGAFRYGVPATANALLAAGQKLGSTMVGNLTDAPDEEAIIQRGNEYANRRLNTETPVGTPEQAPIRRAVDPNSPEGQALARSAQYRSQQQAYAPDDPRAKLPERLVGAALESAPSIAATIVGGLAGGPATGLAVGSAMAGGDKYAERREKGESFGTAATAGAASGAFEAIGEVVPLGFFLKQIKGLGKKAAGSVLSRVTQGVVSESSGEAVTQALNEAYDSGVLDEQTTLKDALGRIGFAAGVGGVMGGGVQGAIETARAPSAVLRYWTNKGVNPKLADLLTRKAEDKAFKTGTTPSVKDAVAAFEEASDDEFKDSSDRYKQLRETLSEKAARAAMKADLISDSDLAAAEKQTETPAVQPVAAEVPRAPELEAAPALDAAIAEQTGESNGPLAEPVAEGVPVGGADGAGDGSLASPVGTAAEEPAGDGAGMVAGGVQPIRPVSGAGGQSLAALSQDGATEDYVALPPETGTLGIPRAEKADGANGKESLTVPSAQADNVKPRARPTASWVIRDKQTGEVVMETFDKKKVAAFTLNKKKYEAVPIAEHLASLSAKPSVVKAKKAVEPDPFAPSAPAKKAKPATSSDIADRALRGLIAEIKNMGGLSQAEMPDIVGERAKGGKGIRSGLHQRLSFPSRKGVPVGMFTKNGVSMDRLRERLQELGYFPDEGDVTGDAETVRDMVRAAMDGDGEAVLSPSDWEEFDALRNDELNAAAEQAAMRDLDTQQREQLAIQNAADQVLSEDEIEDISRRFDGDDDSYFTALQEATNAKRKQEDDKGGVEADDAAGAGDAEAAREGSAFQLETQTEAELASEGARKLQAKIADEKAAKAADAKAKADTEAKDFRLSGSDRPADVAMAAGQKSMFGASGQPAQKKPTEPKAAAREVPSDRMAAVHNLSAENLAFADKMGGIAVPSIAVVRPGQAISGFGEITLIGRKGIADPTENPVFNADAYSPRFPRPEYAKVPMAKVQPVVDRFRAKSKEMDDGSVIDTIWDNSVNKGNPQEIISQLLRSRTAMALYLETIGKTVKPVMRRNDGGMYFDQADTPQVASYISKHGYDFDYGDTEKRTAFTEAIRAAHRVEAEKLPEGEREWYVKTMRTDADGLVPFQTMVAILRTAKDTKENPTRVASMATEEALKAKLKGKEPAFKAWVEEQILPMFKEPYLTVDRRRVPYTLPNIVEAMSGLVKGQEKTMTVGPGMLRALGSTRFTEMQWMRNAALWQIKPEADVEAARKEAETALEAYRNAVIGAYKYSDTWNALDDSMRALAKGGTDPAKLRAALRSLSFDTSRIDDDDLRLGVKAAKAMLSTPVPYFEAKPQRAVELSEFAGAVVPSDASKETLALLEKHGIPWKKYAKDSKEGRAEAVGAMQKKLAKTQDDVLFAARVASPRTDSTDARAEAVRVLGSESQTVTDMRAAAVEQFGTNAIKKMERSGSLRFADFADLPSHLQNFLLEEVKDPLLADAKALSDLGVRQTVGPKGERRISIPLDALAYRDAAPLQGGRDIAGGTAQGGTDGGNGQAAVVQGDGAVDVVGRGSAAEASARLKQPTSVERRPNGGPMQAAKRVRYLLISSPGLSHLKGLVKVPGQRLSVDSSVILDGDKLKIVDGVIKAIPVDMVDVLFSGKGPADKPFHDLPMRSLLPGSVIDNVSLSNKVASPALADRVRALRHLNSSLRDLASGEAVYDEKTGTSYIIADIASKSRIKELIVHEVAVHAELEELLGADMFRDALKYVQERYEAGDSAFVSAKEYVASRPIYKNLVAGTPGFNEEVLARWAETADIRSTWMQRLINAVRRFLYRKGLFRNYNPELLRGAVVAALRNAKARKGAASVTNPDIRAAARSPDEPRVDSEAAKIVADRNRALREQDQTVWQKAKKMARRQLSPQGLLPDSVFDENMLRERKIRVVDFDVRARVSLLERAIRAEHGKSADSLTENEQRAMNEVLAGKGDASLIPERIRTALYAMRQYIDRQSEIYLDMLEDQLAGKEGADETLINTIRNNIGSYVNRSYRAFDDPKWFKSVPDDVLEAGRKYLADGYIEKGLSPKEAEDRAEVALHALLKNGTAYDSMQAFIQQSKLGAKDLSVLMRRKEVPKAIRDLLGEYVDPRLNFAKSATKMGALIWNQIFLDRVRANGLGTFLFDGDDRPPAATKQIAGDASETYSPLNGLWTYPEVAQAFEDALGKEKMGDTWRFIVRLNGVLKYGKTVLSPTTAMRNFQSSMFFALANGHFDVTKLVDAVQLIRHAFSDDAKARAYARKLTDLGVIGDGAHALEVMRLISDSKVDELLASKTGNLAGAFKRANNIAQGFYKFGDDFWKVIGFENELKLWKASGLSQDEAEKMAAKRVIDTYPTYSMQGRLVKNLARTPFIASFPTFTAEIIRTSVNMAKYTAADLASKNPAIRQMGIKRAVGMLLVGVGFHALAALSKMWQDVDDDEEDAVRALGPPWSKNSTYLFAGRDEKGELRYYDLSFLDPYLWWKRPVTAMLKREPWQDNAASALADVFAPFLSPDIAFGALVELIANKKETGGRIYSENDSVAGQTADIANHLRKAVQPGFVANMERMGKALQGEMSPSGKKFDMGDEMQSLLGWRASTLDPKAALYYRSFDFTDARSDSKSGLTRTLKDLNEVSDATIEGKVDEALRQHRRAYAEMGTVVSAARKGGLDDDAIYEILVSSRVSKDAANALIEGSVPPLYISNKSAAEAVQAAEAKGGEEIGETIAKRYEKAQELLEEKQP